MFYWRNDTPSFVTWRSRLATAPDTLTCTVIHGGQFIGGVHTPNQFVPEIISPLPCSPALVRHTLLIVYFFKELISFIGLLDKCHTSFFNALIALPSSTPTCSTPLVPFLLLVVLLYPLFLPSCAPFIPTYLLNSWSPPELPCFSSEWMMKLTNG